MQGCRSNKSVESSSRSACNFFKIKKKLFYAVFYLLNPIPKYKIFKKKIHISLCSMSISFQNVFLIGSYLIVLKIPYLEQPHEVDLASFLALQPTQHLQSPLQSQGFDLSVKKWREKYHDYDDFVKSYYFCYYCTHLRKRRNICNFDLPI